MDTEGGLSLNHKLPWRNLMVGKADMEFFKKQTHDAVVIMGARTWDSLNRCPLTNRAANIVVSTREEVGRALSAQSLDQALELAKLKFPDKKVYVIGGAKLFETAFQHPLCKDIFLTQIPNNFGCNCFLNQHLLKNFRVVKHIAIQYRQFQYTTTTTQLEFNYSWEEIPKEEIPKEEIPKEEIPKEDPNINFAEFAYLKLMERLLQKSAAGDSLVPNRTGISCVETLSETLKFDLRNHTLPLLTSKLTFFHPICVELLWFLRGQKDISFLHKHNVHIWDANTSAEALKKRKLDATLKPGECGPVYGCQWRNFNSQSIDQLRNVIQAIERVKQNPCDEEARRLLVLAYNPAQLPLMALPPCHILMQFHVNNNELNCMMLMRSADLPLGVPFNIGSYALLTFIIAHLTNLKPGWLYITMNICSAYENQFKLMRQQLEGRCYPFPKLRFSDRLRSFTDLDQIAFQAEPEDFIVENYFHSPSVLYPMAA